MAHNRPLIGLVTLDLRLASAVKKIAPSYNVEVIHVVDPADLPLEIQVVISHRNELKKLDRGAVLYEEDFDSVDGLVEKAVELALVGPKYRLVVVAVDPGKNLGAIYLVDGKVIKSRRYGEIGNLIEDVKKFMRSHSDAERRCILLGATSEPQIVEKVLKEFERQLRGEDVAMVVVDESSTSKGLIPKLKGMSKDEYAALMLTLKNILKLK